MQIQQFPPTAGGFLLLFIVPCEHNQTSKMLVLRNGELFIVVLENSRDCICRTLYAVAMSAGKPTDVVSQLCPNCGLCCDSTLFADVELRADDDAGRLAELGLSPAKKGSKLAFAQPCACFDGKLCQIYADRPKRCRLFECGLLKKVQANEMTQDTALKKIDEARKRATKVRELLRQSGQREERMALTRRYAEAMSAPVNLSATNEAERRGELMLAVNDLMQLLQRDFLR